MNSQYAKQHALASAVWAATAGTLLFFGSSGTKEEGVAESREETQPREIRGRGPWEGVLLIITCSFKFVCWRSRYGQGWACAPRPQLPVDLEPRAQALAAKQLPCVESICTILCNPHNGSLGDRYYCNPHFTDEETEALRHDTISPRPSGLKGQDFNPSALTLPHGILPIEAPQTYLLLKPVSLCDCQREF